MINNFKCENCGRNMGDIDEPICHQCEVEERDAEADYTDPENIYNIPSMRQSVEEDRNRGRR